MKRTRITITGHVQGVWFRKSAKEEAEKLGLVGWVKNLSNGGVLAEAEGKSADVERFITWCYKGPENAVVTGVETENVPLEADFSFVIRQ
jgi:acylphosphatase